MQYAVIPRDAHFEHLKVNKGGQSISKTFQGYCLRTGVALKYVSTNTRQHIVMSTRFGRIPAALVRCKLAYSILQKLLWRKLMFPVAFLGNRAPVSAISMQSPYNMLHRTEPDLRRLRVVGARAIVHIETYPTYSKQTEMKAVKGRLVGCSNNSKSF